eukprot:gnl/TRDRNA2_/TRDRNA2_152033_c0_seq1.p1 gnl/TRDRNA2_/TRDRNA2_152033_c0~~gnl/TRDRNA2_/TRDRNA2_152033_c0_seq1.p1  ORF type:complete len:644 (+),score=138.57 gnl/TRDRNA2_/TRDRNA2_152033_c0_seq1:48-1934(+)
MSAAAVSFPAPPSQPPPSPQILSDADLETQARAMAEKALPTSLPAAIRAQKLPAVKEKILDRLRVQRDEARLKADEIAKKAQEMAAEEAKVRAEQARLRAEEARLKAEKEQQIREEQRKAKEKAEEEAKAAAKAKEAKENSLSFLLSRAAARAPSPPPPADRPKPAAPQSDVVVDTLALLKVEGVELCGDEPWFADETVRGKLQASVAEAHKEQRILVGQPADEVDRICPARGHILGAGAVLRLGGAHLGGYGEQDIAYAYRQLSRVLHPDKNPGIAKAPRAFQRLSEAADELRGLLRDQRDSLRAIAATMGGTLIAELSERPQEALFADTCRMLSAVCGLLGEGWVPEKARSRAPAAFTSSPAYLGCLAQPLLNEWLGSTKLLELCGGAGVRAAYDCAPKRLRAQFLCFLDRAVGAEARHSGGGDCVRASWKLVLEAFPELGLWRALRKSLRQRVWDAEEDAAASSGSKTTSGRSRSRSSSSDSRGPDPKKAIVGHPETREKASRWALKWRTALAAILPSGLDGAVSPSNPEVRKLAKAMWKDVATWAGQGGEADAEAAHGLELFRAEPNPRDLATDQSPAEWAFIPMSDLMLIIGEGLVGITSEGVFAKNRRGHKPKSLASCYKKA